MPGCTVPFCSNNTKKGFKVYHFPRDEERNLIWVQNCGRGQNWQPTNYTCICEAHFEDSQFESHRADGMRKLKPNAIPTIFKKKPRCYTKKLKNNRPNADKDLLDIPVPASSYVQFILDGSTNYASTNSEGESTFTVLVNSELPVSKDEDKSHNSQNVSKNSRALEILADHSYPKTHSIPSIIESEVTPTGTLQEKQDCIEEQSTQSTLSSSPVMSGIFTEDKHERKNRQSFRTIKLKTVHQPGKVSKCKRSATENLCQANVPYKIEDLKCYICGKLEKRCSGTPLHTNTKTSKKDFFQKLTEIVASENLSLTVEKDGVLCSQCTVLLNYADRIDSELKNINASVVNHLRQKTGTNSQSSAISASMRNAESIVCHPWTLAYSDTRLQTKSNASSHPCIAKKIQCHLCRFRTPHKSLMLFHLREHIRKSCWCDFCKITLKEKDKQYCDQYNSNSNASEVTLQRLSTDEEVNGDIEILYNASETPESVVRVERTDEVGLSNYDTSSQVLVIPYNKNLNTSHNGDVDLKRCNESEKNNCQQSYACSDKHSPVLRTTNTNSLCSVHLSNVTLLRSTVIDNVSVLNTDKQINTLNNLQVEPIIQPRNLESEMILLESKSSDTTQDEQFRSLHDVGLFDVQEISDSGGNVFIL